MDKNICPEKYSVGYESSCQACDLFISRFAGPKDNRGFIFTLNQDLFLERFYSNSTGKLLSIPGLLNAKWMNRSLPSTLEEEDWVQLPQDLNIIKADFEEKPTARFVYIKLHGSYGWKAKDVSNVMVIGRSKTKIIEQEPLLKWYFSIFQEVLHGRNKNLIVIGYGFGDEHINRIIAQAIDEFDLKLYVVLPKDPAQFKAHLSQVAKENFEVKGRKIAAWKTLWYGLAGYYQDEITKFWLPTSSQLTPKGESLFRDLGIV